MSNFKYVPVLRYRESERAALKKVTFTNKIIPLLEVVTEKPKSNSKQTCIDGLIEYSSQNSIPIMVDFPLYIKISARTAPGVASFVRPLQLNPSKKLQYFQKLKGTNIIPVVSYNPNITFSNGVMVNEINALRSDFDRIAIRLFENHFNIALNEIKSLLRKDDILILDIDKDDHSDNKFKPYYAAINLVSRNNKCTSVLIRSAINGDITNTGLTNNQVCLKADNSLLKAFSNYGFDTFGDYCGIKKDDLTEGGQHSPGTLFYHWDTNAFYGHKGTYKDIVTFTTQVTPSLIQSREWAWYSLLHKQTCVGCVKISNISQGLEKGNSAPKWKQINCAHYLHTMEEFL